LADTLFASSGEVVGDRTEQRDGLVTVDLGRVVANLSAHALIELVRRTWVVGVERTHPTSVEGGSYIVRMLG
jgi:hypothetical protein